MIRENDRKFQFQGREDKIILKIHCTVTQPCPFVSHVTSGSVAPGRAEVCDGAQYALWSLKQLLPGPLQVAGPWVRQ